MKNLFLMACIGVFPLIGSAQKAASPSLEGKVFIEKADDVHLEHRAEVRTHMGYFEFKSHNLVNYSLNGNDSLEQVQYKQVGRWVYIEDILLKFNASADILIEQKSGTHFMLVEDED